MTMATIIKRWLGIEERLVPPYTFACAKIYMNGSDPITWDGVGVRSVEWVEDEKKFNVVLESEPIGTEKFVAMAEAYAGDVRVSHTNDEEGRPLLFIQVLDRQNNSEPVCDNFRILVTRVAD